MPAPLLPPRGIFVPTRMIFNQQLPAAVLVTWIQLRCLAWSGWATPPLSIPELASLTGIHPARLNRHLSQLEEISSLSCRTGVTGKIIISFPEDPIAIPESHAEDRNHVDSTLPSSEQHASPGPSSYFPRQILGYLSFQEDLDEFSDDDLSDNNLWEAEAPGTRPLQVGKDLADNQNSDLNLVRKFHKSPSMLNHHGGHAYP